MISPVNPSGTRVLVVDDNAATRYSTVRVLAAAGAAIAEAQDGAAALAAAADAEVVVLDVKLPDIDGYQVCRLLREQDATRNTPIVHFSAAYVTDNNKIYGLESGADAYLTHPVEPEMLVATINTLLRARRAEEENRRTSRLLGSVFRAAGVGIGVVDANGSVIEANPSFCAMVGRARAAIVGRPIGAVAGGAFADAIARAADGVLTHTLLRRDDDTDIMCEWNAVDVGTGDRVIVISDITGRHHLEQERRSLLESEQRARGDAERANASKDEFLATLSHELRNPLNNILGWTNILQRSPGEAERHDALGAINRNVHLQVQLVEDLLDVSRIAAGKLRLERRRVELASLLHEAVQASANSARTAGVELVLDAPEPVRLDADATRLQQVVGNLLSNAIKFAGSGGHVSVRLRRDRAHATIEVLDDGAGIAPELLPHVFDRFRQGDSGTTRRASGLGLGLAIVRSLVELHDGRVVAHSDGPGRGARFEVRLPLPADALTGTPADAGADAGHEPPLAGCRVLVVDDSPEARRLLTFALEDWGAQVAQAGSVDEALRQIDAAQPDFLVSDISMPDRDGYDLVRTVRARGIDGVALPAVAVTAFAADEDARRAIDAGFQDHVTKPLDMARLLRSLERLRLRARNGGQ